MSGRISHALHEAYLTVRDFAWPPEPAPVRRPLRPMVPPEHDVFSAVVHPYTEPTVFQVNQRKRAHDRGVA